MVKNHGKKKRKRKRNYEEKTKINNKTNSFYYTFTEIKKKRT